jgi:HlyD family secretion protein
VAGPDISKLTIDRDAAAHTWSRRRRWPWVVALVLVAGAVGLGLVDRFGSAVSVETTSVTTAYPSQAFTALSATGYAVAQRKAAVASKATGRLEWLGVMEGSHVTKDEVIARLESRDVAASREQAAAGVKVAQANVEQARADLRDAEQSLARSIELAAKNYVSDAALDTARARADKSRAALRSSQASLAVAVANLKAADVALDQTRIRAPFDGVVLTKNANVGDNITPFSSAVDTKGAVVTIADMETLEVEADVSESSLSKIRVGQPCEIQLDAIPGRRFAGVVNRIVPTVDRAKATVLVKVKFVERDPRVLPDMSAKVAFLEREPAPGEQVPVVAVQTDAIAERKGSKVVFVVKDGRAAAVRVEPGRRIGELTEVRGVTAGTRVVLRPLDRVADGTRVTVAQR